MNPRQTVIYLARLIAAATDATEIAILQGRLQQAIETMDAGKA